MKKWIVTILLTVFVISLAGTVFAQKSDTIVFIPKSTDVTYWLFLRKGAADKGKELGYKVDYQGVARESEIAGQVSLVSNIAASKPAGILMAATDAKALVPPVEQAIKDGVPIIMVDSGVDSDAPYASITTDNFDGAYKAGKLLAEMIGGKGKVINLGITAGSETGVQRSEGFIKAIQEYPDIVLLPVQWTSAEAATAMNITSDLLTSNPDINGIFSAAAPMGVGAAQALKARQLDKKVKLVTFDPSPEVLPLFEEGVIHGIIAQDPYQMGYHGVELLDTIIKGGTLEEKKIQIPVAVITAENYEKPETQKLLQTPDKF
ncbi:MAG: ABC transporter substrate-binding protein [Candidatus Vecturithrix sp.]|jgi:ribose transport system substrate-binding protein|nr:ABC transporter substrate-binding protein [Candidatus Vecturithrix sp.]